MKNQRRMTNDESSPRAFVILVSSFVLDDVPLFACCTRPGGCFAGVLPLRTPPIIRHLSQHRKGGVLLWKSLGAAMLVTLEQGACCSDRSLGGFAAP